MIILLLNNGNIIVGTNVENASSGLANCAERTALFTAVTQGYKKEDEEVMFKKQDEILSAAKIERK